MESVAGLTTVLAASRANKDAVPTKLAARKILKELSTSTPNDNSVPTESQQRTKTRQPILPLYETTTLQSTSLNVCSRVEIGLFFKQIFNVYLLFGGC
jgi:hypothetical protein